MPTIDRIAFTLKVRQIGTACDFELFWGKGQYLNTQLDYPTEVIELYRAWQRVYLNYYQQLRGRVVNEGKVQGRRSPDWRALLVRAETELLDRFHYWLVSPELFPISRTIAEATVEAAGDRVEVFLACPSPELAHLPWETWEIGTTLGAKRNLHITRTPANILNEPVRPLGRKPRILAILGDDTGLDFKGDIQAVESIFGKNAVTFEGWRSKDEDVAQLKERIVRAIADERGWDILFFIGHSNESTRMGGELSIAPNQAIYIREIEPALKQAKKQGLQFAIFNSCSGIDIATSLINLGLNQVAIMREPIHNKVAQSFLLQFLRSLAQYKDVSEALQDACQFLRQQEVSLNYPSAYLIPSLFRHPEAPLFRLRPGGRWLPNRSEAIALGGVLLLSLLTPVQTRLLAMRQFAQSLYRQTTQQVSLTDHPPVLLVQIDEQSRRRAPEKLQEIYPINYAYLSQLVRRLSALDAKAIGIDYVLDRDRQQPQESRQLAQEVKEAVGQGAWLVFGAMEDSQSPAGVSPEIASLNWSLQGDIHTYSDLMELPQNRQCQPSCPFAYLLALASHLHRNPSTALPQPNLERRTDLRSDLFQSLGNRAQNLDEATTQLHQLRLPAIAKLTQWFHPIIDFSLPPNRVYERISAYQLLEGDVPSHLDDQVAIIAPGGYSNAGVRGRGEDNQLPPLSILFWENWSRVFTGGETQAYILHHLLTERLVIPIPDFYMVLVAALLGKGTLLFLQDNPHRRRRLTLVCGGVTGVYLLVGLQVYISAAVLIPWLFPSVVFWSYLLRRKSR